MDGFLEDIATGTVPRKLRIAGRPRPGREEEYLLLEEPDEPVQMHWNGRLVPHFKRNCKNCDGGGTIKPFWYLGAMSYTWNELVIVEFTWICHRSAEEASRMLDERGYMIDPLRAPGNLTSRFRGLVVKMSRGDFQSSPRVLRPDGRRGAVPEWPYHTRLELARIWEVPVKPKLYTRQEIA